MELWIRSKSKKRLVKANFIEIGNLEYTNGDVDIMVNDMGFGTYSKERALEVLDEIQNILEPLLIVKNCTNKEEKQKASEMCNISDYIGTANNCDIHLLSNTYVYQMPEE